MLQQSPWILPNPPEMVSQFQSNRRCHTARLAPREMRRNWVDNNHVNRRSHARETHLAMFAERQELHPLGPTPPSLPRTTSLQRLAVSSGCVVSFSLRTREKKSAKFWATHPSGPEFWMLNFGTSKGEPERWGPERWARRVGGPKAWPKKLTEIEVGQSQNWPKSKFEFDRARSNVRVWSSLVVV